MTVLINDTFTAANNTTLSGRTPSPTTVGNNWVVNSGTWQIESNTAQNTASSGDVTVEIDCGQADVTYTCTFITPSTSWNGGIIANFVDANNFWLFDSGTFNTSAIYEKAAGTYTQRAVATTNLAANTTYTLGITTLGDAITCFINGSQVMTYSTAGRSSKTATKFGFRRDSAGGVTPSWDDFLIISAIFNDPLWFGMTA